jgi:nucleoside-diphosphate-sugar epimerase
MAILITGGAGFIGSFLIRSLLKRGERVVIIDTNLETPSMKEILTPGEQQQILQIRGDIADPVFFYRTVKEQQVDRIVHLAMVSGRVENDPWESVRINVTGTMTSFEAARLFGIKRVVWASTAQVFGRHTALARNFGMTVLTDDTVRRPRDMYTAVKSLDEYMGEHYQKKFGVDTRGLRPIGVFGPGRRGSGRGALLTEMVKAAAFGKPFNLPNGDLALPLSYVEDVARAFEVALYYEGTELTGRVVNIGAHSTSHRELAEITRRVAPGAEITVGPGDDGEPITLPVDNSGLSKATGFKMEVSLEEAIRRTMEHFRRMEKKA